MLGPMSLSLLISFAPAQDAPPSELAEAPAEGGEEAPPAELEALTGPAYADELKVLPKAQRSKKKMIPTFDSGFLAYGERRFADAIEFFAEAYKTYPTEGLLFSLGQSHRKLYELNQDKRHLRFAILRYGQCLRLYPEWERAGEVSEYLSSLLAQSELGPVDEQVVVTRVMISTKAEDAWMRIDEGERVPAPGVQPVEPGKHTIQVGGPGYDSSLQTVDVPEGATVQLDFTPKPIPARVTIDGPKGAEVSIDGRRIGKLPLSEAVELEPGVHFIGVTRNGHVAYTRQFAVARDEDFSVQAEMRGSTQRTMSYAMIGLGGGGVIASAVTMGLAFAAQGRAAKLDDDFSNNGNGTEDQYATYLDEVDRRDQFRTAAIASGAVGAGLLITGFVLFAFDKPQVDVPIFDRERRVTPERKKPVLSAAPILSPTTAGAMAQVRF
jgi:hypothetical protein